MNDENQFFPKDNSDLTPSQPIEQLTNPFDELNMINNIEQPVQQSTTNTFFSSPNQGNVYQTGNVNNSNPFQENYQVKNNIIKTSSLQNINKIKIKKEKISQNSIQVILIPIVALSISVFMFLTLAFNIKLLHINGTSMSPTMTNDNWVISSAQKEYDYGDIIAFYHKDVIMIKRIIAKAGDTVLIDIAGNVYVNGNLVNEPYITSPALGDPEIDFPYTVKHDSYFVLGDNRGDSLDSRNIAIKDIKETDILGKVSYSIIPFKHLT